MGFLCGQEPVSSPLSLNDALRRHIAGDLEAAESAYRERLAHCPDDGNAWNLIGVLLHQTGRGGEAGRALERAVALLPDFADAHSNRAMVALDLGDLATARLAVERALALAPGHRAATALALAWHRKWGAAALAAGDFLAALSRYEAALAVFPAAAELRLDLANTLRCLGRPVEALTHYRQAVEQAESPQLRARHAVALATVLRETGQWMAALETFRTAISADPGLADAWQGTGVLLLETGRAAEALPVLERSVALAPGHAGFHSTLLGALHYTPTPDDRYFPAHLAWAERHAPAGDTSSRRRQVIPQRPKARWRVGLLSADLRTHPVARFLESWLPHVAGGTIEYRAYSDAAVEDETSRRLSTYFDAWVNVRQLSDRALAERLASDELDLLIELSGHTAPNRLPALAARPVDRIWSWLGYPGTTGMTQVDVRLSDALADPPGSAVVCSERLVRFSGCFLCYAPPAEVVNRLPGAGCAPGERFVFGSFNNLAKLSEPVIASWSRILAATPDSCLKIKSFVLSDPAVADDVRRRFADHGIAASRLELSGFVNDQAAHFALYDEIDLALDPFPYNGTTTTCDALWMGVPVLVLMGSRHAGRVGVSLLHAALGGQAADWVAASTDDYERKAIAVAAAGRRDSAQRLALRRQVAASALLDGRRFASQITAILLENLGPSAKPDFADIPKKLAGE